VTITITRSGGVVVGAVCGLEYVALAGAAVVVVAIDLKNAPTAARFAACFACRRARFAARTAGERVVVVVGGTVVDVGAATAVGAAAFGDVPLPAAKAATPKAAIATTETAATTTGLLRTGCSSAP
jgi:hypothetical protein